MLGIFIDIETTGLDPYRHRCLEIAIQLVNLHNIDVVDTYDRIIQQPKRVWEASDPESLVVNGFTWERSQEGVSEEQAAQEIEALLSQHHVRRGSAVFVAQNSSFDRAFFAQLVDTYRQEELKWPYHWLDLASMFWGRHAPDYVEESKKAIPLSKNAIAKSYDIPPETSPHRALNGVDHLLRCYRALMQE